MFRRSLQSILGKAVKQANRPRLAAQVFQASRLLSKPAYFHQRARLQDAPDQVANVPVTKIVPRYQITFTCKACDARTTHQMTKQAYSKGTVLIQCPSCKNRHLIADNLKIFSDTNINIEDILREKGQSIEKGQIQEGDLEFFPEEATTTDEQKVISSA